MLNVSREFGAMIIAIAWGPGDNSNRKALQCLWSLSKASNPIAQLEQHLYVSKPQVNQIKYDYKPRTKRETKTVQWWKKKYNRPKVERRLVGVGWRRTELERQERRVWACVNEKGWGLVVGECSKGMSGKAGIPQGSFRGLCGSVGRHTQCMAVPSSRRRLCQWQQWGASRGARKIIGTGCTWKRYHQTAKLTLM